MAKPVPCNICPSGTCKPDAHSDGEFKTRMERDTLCFDCAFWSIQRDNKHELTIIERDAFKIELKTIAYFAGETVKAFSILPVGIVPEHWQSRLPDNARWVTGRERPIQPKMIGKPHIDYED